MRHRHSARVGRERRRQVSPLSHGCATRCAHCLHHAVNPSRRARSDQGKQAAGQTRSGQRPGLAGVFMRSQVHNGAYWRALAVACSSHLRPHPDRVDSLSQPKELRRNATASDRACLIDAIGTLVALVPLGTAIARAHARMLEHVGATECVPGLIRLHILRHVSRRRNHFGKAMIDELFDEMNRAD